MTDLLQLIVSGMATGAIYALAALGFTLLWQASGTVNFAQGEFVMVPAFLMLFFMHVVGAPLWLAFVLAVLPAVVILGWAFKGVVVEPLIRHGVIPLVIATLGLSTGIKYTVKAGYSAEAHPFPSSFPDALLSIGALRISYADIGTLLLAGLIVMFCAGIARVAASLFNGNTWWMALSACAWALPFLLFLLEHGAKLWRRSLPRLEPEPNPPTLLRFEP